jgi:quercetin dioxygenase-like cupin family protein
MVRVVINKDRVRFEIEGMDKLWAMRSHIDIPLEHIVSVRVDKEEARGWFHGLRLPGTQIPGVITAGTFYQSEGWVFFDVHDPDNTVVIELDHERYKRLVIEVEDPEKTVTSLREAIGRRGSASMAKVHRWTEVAPEQINPTILRRYITGDGATVARFELSAGGIVPMHSHPQEQISVVLSGRLEFRFPNALETVSANEVIQIPGGLPHEVRTIEDALVIDVFNPIRQDWIDGTDTYFQRSAKG